MLLNMTVVMSSSDGGCLYWLCDRVGKDGVVLTKSKIRCLVTKQIAERKAALSGWVGRPLSVDWQANALDLQLPGFSSRSSGEAQTSKP